ncbi:GNAT family protein [Tepidibacillus infernus]|uniref:N-acetyltransferase domain-containing protein n=2 Tax=Tepidibacillus TaxID=1494427 RepID=A0A135L207_9BACI|nr:MULTISPECIES: GNAT family protein [Tepidibacillus]KXG43038.1 hypothetical protein U473_02620 [Tepidibacillus decaturensis]GBF10827.1 putative ribosomal N-acetyltransferase YdaF [Tepidibacillus sp. HK-1]
MLKGKLVQLKAVERENLSKYLEWVNDPEVTQYLSPQTRFPKTLAEEHRWYDNLLKQDDKFVFSIYTRADDRMIGSVGLHSISWKNQWAIAGIFIGDKDYWGKGYGTEAFRLCLYIGFQELGLQRVELGVYAFNERAIKSYQKLGFVEEGRRRRFLYRNGQFYDEVMMSILREEYLERYQKEDEERWKTF